MTTCFRKETAAPYWRQQRGLNAVSAGSLTKRPAPRHSEQPIRCGGQPHPGHGSRRGEEIGVTGNANRPRIAVAHCPPSPLIHGYRAHVLRFALSRSFVLAASVLARGSSREELFMSADQGSARPSDGDALASSGGRGRKESDGRRGAASESTESSGTARRRGGVPCCGRRERRVPRESRVRV